MTKADSVILEAARLLTEGRPYALATVVDVRRPASTRRGDRALITGDGVLIGWVGGACSEPIVVREALRCLADGRPRLVRIAPPGERLHQAADRDVILAESHCASEGAVEVLIEPQVPKPLLAVVGDAPAARTLVELARTIGWRVSGELTEPVDAVVVATMGRMDEDLLAAALKTGAGYVGLIASARRAGAVLSELRDRGLGEEQLARVRSPAGLDLGPCAQEEIAVAILAELVAWSHMRGAPDDADGVRAPVETVDPLRVETVDPLPVETVDPVCGMTVAAVASGESAVHGGVRFWFCSSGCRARFEADPSRYAVAQPTGRPGQRDMPA